MDADATLVQVNALVDAGCDLVRVTVPSREALGPFERICHESPVPIVADIHFDYRLAIGAVRAGAAKLRINPGNIGDWERVDAVIDAAGEAGAAIRIGVNAGLARQAYRRAGRPNAAGEARRLVARVCRAFREARIRRHRAFR
ncbi:MAG: flavodoxin-dependent (E)-4-hydroxy-3-methylbut-2-enyl-diphosphate synthase [Collinsella sp.]